MIRFYFTISRTDQWYEIMRECRAWFGSNWRSQPRVRRRLNRVMRTGHPIWFEVPDERFGTWISVKMALQVRAHAAGEAAK